MASKIVFVPSAAITAAIPTLALNSIAGLGSAIGAASLPTNGFPQTSQYFFTVPFANNQPVLYQLEITNSSAEIISTYTFPLTPNNVTKSVISLTNYYDVQGSNTGFGVQRIIDQYGLTPPIITISGSTGFQFHSTDGYQWSGRSSFALLVQFIQQYASLVTQASNSNPPTALPTMTFYDGYTGEAFNVVPLNQQAYSMDVAKPIIQTYNLQFLAQTTITPQAVPLTSQDPLAIIFIEAQAVLTAAFLSWWEAILATLPGGIIQ